MRGIISIYDRWVGTCQGSAADLSSLLARVTLGWLFIDSGWQKRHNLDQIMAFFASLGIPAPQWQAPMVATMELVGGSLLLVGLLTRLASVPLMATLGVAIITARKDDLHTFSDLIGFVEFLYLLLLVGVLVHGAGKISLDRLLVRRRTLHT